MSVAGRASCCAWRAKRGTQDGLCGLDPAEAMLQVAQQRPDVEWVHGDLASVDWHREFDLVVMTGHAFQVLVDDRSAASVAGRDPLSPHRRRPLRV